MAPNLFTGSYLCRMTAHEQELLNLHDFFHAAKFPEVPFHLNEYMIIHDVKVFIGRQIQEIEGYNGTEAVRDSLFGHLRQLKELCLKES